MSQQQKILRVMASEPGKWYYPYDFMPPRMDISNPNFVGYEASARLSELAKEYPDLIETEQDGKYKKRRLNMYSSRMWSRMLPKDLYDIVKDVKIIYPLEVNNKPVQKAVSWLED